MSWLSEVFQMGGPFFIVNTFFLAVVIGLIVERAIYFLGRGHLNAKAFLEVQREFGSFDSYVWTFVGGAPKKNGPKTVKNLPASSPESDALSKDLRKRGFTFVGSTICYALMQATGMVNDHLVTCPRHAELGG